MNKRLLIIIIGIGVLILATIAYLAIVISHRKVATSTPVPTTASVSSSVLPSTYSVHITELNGNFTAQLLTTDGSVSTIDSTLIQNYINSGLNITHDTMWISCPTGYGNTATTLDKGISGIGHDPDLGIMLSITPNQQEIITVTCSKK